MQSCSVSVRSCCTARWLVCGVQAVGPMAEGWMAVAQWQKGKRKRSGTQSHSKLAFCCLSSPPPCSTLARNHSGARLNQPYSLENAPMDAGARECNAKAMEEHWTERSSSTFRLNGPNSKTIAGPRDNHEWYKLVTGNINLAGIVCQ